MENKMQEYLLDKYNDNNHIMNWLQYWLKGKKMLSEYNNNAAWRKENDLDCLYFDGDLYADTIISIWMIMRMVLNCIHKNIRIYKDIAGIEQLIVHFEYYFPINNPMVAALEKLCEKAEQRANFMRLPNRGMQIRGKYYADQVPATLYQCFPDGVFSKYFDEISLEDWIKREHLEVAFIDLSKITRDNIKPISNSLSAHQCVKNSRKQNLVMDVINYSINFIDERAKFLSDLC